MRKMTRLVAGATALAVASVGLLATSASALPPGSPSENPTVTLAPATGTEATTNFTLTPPAGAACQGDSVAGYKFHGFLAATTVDVGTLVYAGGAPQTQGTGYVSGLFTTAGSTYGNKNPNLTSGTLVGLSTLSMGFYTPTPPNGSYYIGLACTLANATTRFWSTPITITNSTATTFSYAFGAVPSAPTGVSVAAGDAQATVTFSAVTATPPVNAANGYTVTAVPTAGPGFPGATVTATGTASPITVPGLVNGTTYSFTVTATNSVGTGPASSPAVSATPNLGALPGVTNLQAVAGATAGTIVLTWTNPATPGQTGTTITVSPTVPGAPFSTVGSASTFTTPVLPAGAYTFTVTPTYAAANPVTPASVSYSIIAGGVLIQDITVVRPAGALVLTQRCGVYGSAAAYTDDTFGALPLLPASPANADPGPTGYAYGNVPVGTPFNGQPSLDAAGTNGDPLFPQYPYPVDANGVPAANYPTHCGIDLGIGKLITSGPKAGQYFTASGRMAQITVVNTQDVDNGWTLNGRMSTFTRTGGGDSFSGNLLGWNPEVTYDSAPNLDGYDMLVQAGNVRDATSTASLTGLGAISNETNSTLAQSLAKSNAGASLGLAVIDARLRLLIPVAANAGTYTGTLTFTTV